jgi:transcriptional regulator with XRE-family HTH domain
MRFGVLQARVIEHVWGKVRNGEVTVRGLALRAGVSQPHLHNVLSGRRALSPEVADLMLEALNLSLWDVLKEGELPGRKGVENQPWRPATSR